MKKMSNATMGEKSGDDGFLWELMCLPGKENLHRGAKKPAKCKASRPVLSEVVDLSGEVHSLTAVDPSQFRLTEAQRAELLSLNTPKSFCLHFFALFDIKTTPQIRIDGKRQFIRLSLNSGEHIIEEELMTFELSRSAVAMKAVKLFNADIVRTWLQKYKKQKRAITSHFD